MWRLAVPFRYLSIRHSEARLFNLAVTGALSLIFALPLFVDRFRNTGFMSADTISLVSDVVGVLVGFYIAGLAAIATFGNPEMDELMQGPVTLRHDKGGSSYEEELTRRRFLSFLFGYLSLVALAFLVIAGAYRILDAYVLSDLSMTVRTGAFIGFWLLQSITAGSLITHTLLGLFYLTDRVNRKSATPYSMKQREAEAQKVGVGHR